MGNLNIANALKVTVSGGGLPSVAISGRQVDISLPSLAANTGQIIVQYGYKASPTTGGVDAPMLEGDYEFEVLSDPLNDGTMADIALEPMVSLRRPSTDCDAPVDIGVASLGTRDRGNVAGLSASSVVVAPNPARAGQLVCVSLGSAVKKAHWTIYDLNGSPVDKADFGPGAGECYSPAKLASGIYFLKIDFESAQNGSQSVTKKLAIIQ
jgi:hypothetical protein